MPAADIVAPPPIRFVQPPDPAPTYGSRYVFATLEQRTVGAQMRVDYSMTPNLSLQMFVQPLISSGRVHKVVVKIAAT